MLLSRVADSLFWGARYLERAGATARVVRTYTEVIVDLPTTLSLSWEPLLAIAGDRVAFDAGYDRAGESEIVTFLVADTGNRGSIAASVAASRENLRTTREVFPREAWQTVNDLHLYVVSHAEGGVDRRGRSRFLSRVIAVVQQLDGVLTSTMTRDEAYEMWRLGQAIERADMTTRVLGVRAAALLSSPDDVDANRGVQWMGILRSLSALQMYQLATRGPMSGPSVVRFLLLDTRFPRSVAACVQRVRDAVERLPHAAAMLPGVDAVEAMLHTLPADLDGAALDAAMDAVEAGLAGISDLVAATFFRGAA